MHVLASCQHIKLIETKPVNLYEETRGELETARRQSAVSCKDWKTEST